MEGDAIYDFDIVVRKDGVEQVIGKRIRVEKCALGDAVYYLLLRQWLTGCALEAIEKAVADAGFKFDCSYDSADFDIDKFPPVTKEG